MKTTYICTHKDFQIPEWVEGNYKIITDGTKLQGEYRFPVIEADNILKPMKHAYSEGFQIYQIWSTDTTSDWIGINHYRRYFRPSALTSTGVKTDEEINILPIPMRFNVRSQYQSCHNVEDYDEIVSIINEYYPEYDTNIPDIFFPCNCCVLRREIFDEWCDFLFNTLFIYNQRHHLYTDDDVRKFVDTKGRGGDYQARLQAFLMERISTIFFLNYFHNHKECSLKFEPLYFFEP